MDSSKHQLLKEQTSTNSNTIKGHLHKWYLYMWAFTIAFNGFQYGFFMTVFNTAIQYMATILDWKKDGKNNTQLIAFIATLVPFGAIFASAMASYLIKIGRYKMNLVVNAIIIVGTALILVGNTPCFMIGRFMWGLSVGFFAFLIPIFIREISPIGYNGSLTTIFIIIAGITFPISFALGFGLPNTEEAEKQGKNVVYWRIMFGVPFLGVIIQTLLLLGFFKQESPKFYFAKGQLDECRNSLKKIFYSEEDIEEQINQLELQALKKSNDVTWKELFCGKKYTYALIVGCILQFLTHFSGILAVVSYSTKDMFTEKGEQQSEWSILYSTLNGAISLIGHILAFYLIEKLGRRTLMIHGSIILALAEVILGIANVFGLMDFQIVMVFVYMFIYTSFMGSVPLILLAEICPEKGVSFGTVILWGCATLVTFLSKIMIDKSPLQLFGTFWIFGAITFGGAIFSYFCVKETKGKTRMQIQQMYSSK